MKMLNKGIIFLVNILIFSFVFTGTVFAQETPVVEWNETFGGTYTACGHSVQQTSDGGYIITGEKAYFGSYRDVCLIKTYANGTMHWEKRYGGSGYDSGYSVQQTSDGGYIVAAWRERSYLYDLYLIKTDVNGNKLWEKTFNGRLFHPGMSVQQTNEGGYIIVATANDVGDPSDIYLIKTDANGNEQWALPFGGSNSDYGSSVQQTTDGGYIVAGSTQSYGAGASDVYLIKTDANGNEQWALPFGGSNSDYGSSVQQTTDGGYIVAGSTQSYGAGASDVYLIKTDANGNEQWALPFGGSNSDYGSSVQQTTDGGYIVAGSTQSYGAGASDVYLIKTDANGNEQWNLTFGGTNTDYGSSVQQTTDRGYIIVGETRSFGDGSRDVYLIKLMSSWVEVNNTGRNLKIRQAPTTRENNVLKRVPDGWVLKVNNTHQNEEKHDEYVWWEVEDVTDGVEGWSAYKNISDGTEYLEKGEEELKKKTDKLNTKDTRIPVILEAANHYYNTKSTMSSLYSSNDGNNKLSIFSENDFPIELILAVIAQESNRTCGREGGEGGAIKCTAFDNELKTWDGGYGIMQITTTSYKGKGSSLKVFNEQCEEFRQVCTDRDKDGRCIEWTREYYGKYYTNTSQGIYANMKDGLRTLQEKYEYWGGRINKRESITCDGSSIEITSDDFKKIVAIWGYNGISTKSKENYLKDVAGKLKNLNASYSFGENYKEYLTHTISDEELKNWTCKLEWVNKPKNRRIIKAEITSPGELRVYDSQGQVTGLINGEVKEKIPNSGFDSNTVTILFPSDSYKYDIVGTGEGTYGLAIGSLKDGNATAFTATDIPTSTTATHQYTIDWDALLQGEKGVTVQIDSDGDGVFEQTLTTGDTFQPPTNNFTYSPLNPVVNQPITFNASSSYDPDGFITSYEWDFGDGNITSITDPIITHSYASAGNYNVNLTVTDDDGATNSTSQVINVIAKVTSCDAEGDERNQFAWGEIVYVKASGLEANTNYKIWIQDEPVNESDTLVSEENPLSAETPKDVTTDSSGNLSVTLIWSIPSDEPVTYHEYDIVVDKQNDGENTGKYNSASDGIDSADVVGFVAPISETSTLILFSSGLIILIGYVTLKKRGKGKDK